MEVINSNSIRVLALCPKNRACPQRVYGQLKSRHTPSVNDSRRPRSAALEFLSHYYAAFDAAGFPAMPALLSDDVAHDTNEGTRETGRTAFAAFLKRMNRCYAGQLTDLTRWADEAGTRAAAEFTVTGTWLATDAGLPPAHGQTYCLPAGAFLTLADGRISRVTMYYNTSDWLRQIGS